MNRFDLGFNIFPSLNSKSRLVNRTLFLLSRSLLLLVIHLIEKLLDGIVPIDGNRQ